MFEEIINVVSLLCQNTQSSHFLGSSESEKEELRKLPKNNNKVCPTKWIKFEY